VEWPLVNGGRFVSPNQGLPYFQSVPSVGVSYHVPETGPAYIRDPKNAARLQVDTTKIVLGSG